ncbi:MAG TPA: glutamate--tRNA ligase [Alphaproteobacteria bacterium]|jgi:glutamyl-tRNA synthetase|nr:glutamate--tRNA ligase [Alphaproteobacteria bacterium]
MTIVTRFAPSPTGYLHIGGARTALFNWLYARHTGGKFLLRIEDTDRARSTDAATAAIFDGLKWLGLDWDGDAVSQFSRRDRHAEVAKGLLETGQAYYCYATPEELEAMREAQRAAGQPLRYDGRWRDRNPSEAPAGVAPVIRLRAPQTGETVVDDQVQGKVTVANEQLDDMVLLRGDGTPTYMLSVVVDDHDFGVTHIIRGDDHLTNAFRQAQLYRAMGWDTPTFAHIPLIHGPDGKKLSKRHGALGVEAYRDMGYLPETLRNYLLRLGWAHGDDEIISTEQAIRWFDLPGIGRSPSRLDFAKLDNLNGHYIREADNARLAELITPGLEATLERTLTPRQKERLAAGMGGLKARAKTLNELALSARLYAEERPVKPDAKAAALLTPPALDLLKRWLGAAVQSDFSATALEQAARALAEEAGVKLGELAQPLRAALTGSTVSPPVFEVASIFGRDEVIARLNDLHSA